MKKKNYQECRRYTIGKFQNIKGKNNILKIPRPKKKSIMYNKSVITTPLDFSMPKVEAEHLLSVVFKFLRENYFNILKFNTQLNQKSSIWAEWLYFQLWIVSTNLSVSFDMEPLRITQSSKLRNGEKTNKQNCLK